MTADIVQQAIGRLDMESLAFEPLPAFDFGPEEAVLTPDAPVPPAPPPAAPVRGPAVPVVKVSDAPSAPAPAQGNKERRPGSYLTYDAGKKGKLRRNGPRDRRE